MQLKQHFKRLESHLNSNMPTFEQFVAEPEFQALPENSKARSIHKFFEIAGEQHPEGAEGLNTKGLILGQIYDYGIQATQGGQAQRESYERLARLSAERLDLFEAGGSKDDTETLNKEIDLSIQSINERRRLFNDTSTERAKLADLFLKSGQDDEASASLRNRAKSQSDFDKLSAELKERGISEEQFLNDVDIYNGRYEGDVKVDSTGRVFTKPNLMFNTREDIVNRVQNSDISKLKKEEFIEELDDRKSQFAKDTLNNLDNASSDIFKSRIGLGLASNDAFTEFLENGRARGKLEGSTDVEKLDNYVAQLKGQGGFDVGAQNTFGVSSVSDAASSAIGLLSLNPTRLFSGGADSSAGSSDTFGNVSALNRASNSAIAGLLSLNPARLFSEEANQANTEVQKGLLEGRKGFDTITGLNESILDLNDSNFYKIARGLAGTTPTLALMLATGGTTSGAFRAAGARVGLNGTATQGILGAAGAALPATLTTYNDTFVEAINSDKEEVREQAEGLAFKAAAIEQIVTSAFGGLGRFSGVEDLTTQSLKSTITSAGGKEALKTSFRSALTKINAFGGTVAAGTVGEATEETIISALNGFFVEAEKNPDFTVGNLTDSLKEAALTSAVLGGAFKSPQQIRETSQFIRENREFALEPSSVDGANTIQKSTDQLKREVDDALIQSQKELDNPFNAGKTELDVETLRQELNEQDNTDPREDTNDSTIREPETDTQENSDSPTDGGRVEQEGSETVVSRGDSEISNEGSASSQAVRQDTANDPSNAGIPASPSNTQTEDGSQTVEETNNADEGLDESSRSDKPSESEIDDFVDRVEADVEAGNLTQDQGAELQGLTFENRTSFDNAEKSRVELQGKPDEVVDDTTQLEEEIIGRKRAEAKVEDRKRFDKEQTKAERKNRALQSSQADVDRIKGRLLENPTKADRSSVSPAKKQAIDEVFIQTHGEATHQQVLSSVANAHEQVLTPLLRRTGELSSQDRAQVLENASIRDTGSILAKINQGQSVEQATRNVLLDKNNKVKNGAVQSALTSVRNREATSETIGERQIVDDSTSTQSEASSVPIVSDIAKSLTKTNLKESEVKEIAESLVKGDFPRKPDLQNKIVSNLSKLSRSEQRELLSNIDDATDGAFQSKKVDGNNVKSGDISYSEVNSLRAQQLENDSITAFRLKRSDDQVKFLDPESPQITELLNDVMSNFGNFDTVFFQSANPNAVDGEYDPKTNTVFVNVKTQRPLEFVVAHEAAHVLEVQNPELHASLQTNLLSNGLKAPTKGQEKILSSRYDRHLHPSEYFADVIARAFLDARSLSEFETVIDNPSLFKKFTAWFSDVMNRVSLKLRDITAKWFEAGDWEAMGSFKNSYLAAHVLSETLNVARVTSTDKQSGYYVNNGLINDFRRNAFLLEQAGLPTGVANAGVYQSKKITGDADHRQFMSGFLKRTGSLITAVTKKSPKEYKDQGVYDADEYVNSAESILFDLGPFKQFKGKLTVKQYEQMIRLASSGDVDAQQAIDTAVSELNNEFAGDFSGNPNLAPQIVHILFAKRISNLEDNVEPNDKLRLAEKFKSVDIKFNIEGGQTSSSKATSDAAGTLGILGSRVNKGKGYKSYFLDSPPELINASRKIIEKTLGVRAARFLDENLRVHLQGNSDQVSGFDQVVNEISKGENSQFDTTQFERTIRKAADNEIALINKTIEFLQSFDGKQSRKIESEKTISSRQRAIEILMEARDSIGDWKAGQGLKQGMDRLNNLNKLVDQALNEDWGDDLPSKQKAKVEDAKTRTRKSNQKAKATRRKQNDKTDGVADTNENQYLRRRKKAGLKTIEKILADGNKEMSEINKEYTRELRKVLKNDINVNTAVGNILGKKIGQNIDEDLLREAFDVDINLNDLKDRNSNTIELAKEAFARGDISTSDLRTFVDFKSMSQSQKRQLNNFIDSSRRNTDRKRDSRIRKETLERLRRLKAQNKVIFDQLGAQIPAEAKILQKLGVGAFAVDGALEYDPDRGGNLELVKEALPDYMQSRASEVKDLVDKIVRNDGDPKELIEELSEIRANSQPGSKPNFSKWLSEKVKDINFKFGSVDEKKEALRQFLRDRGDDPALDSILKDEFRIDGDLTDGQIERLTNIALKRFDEAIKVISERVAREIAESRGLGKIKIETLRKAVTLNLYDMSLNPNATITQALGKDFTIPISTVQKFIDIDDKILELQQQGISNERIDDLRRTMTRTTVDELKKLQPKLGTPLIEKLQAIRIANLFSSFSTTLGLPVAGGISALTDTLGRSLVSTIGDKKAASNFVNALSQSVGFSQKDAVQNFNLFQSFVDGAKNGLHAVGDVNALNDFEASLKNGSGLIVEQINAFDQSLKNARAKASEGELSVRDATKIAKEFVVMVSALPTGIFNIMGGLDATFSNIAIKMEREAQIEYWRRENNVSESDYNANRDFAQQKTDSYFKEFLDHTELSLAEKTLQANEFYYSTLFEQFTQDPDTTRKALMNSEILVNGMTGNNKIVFGPATMAVSTLMKLKNKSADFGKYPKAIVDIATFPFLVIPSAASTADSMMSYIPGSTLVMRAALKATPSDVFTKEKRSSFVKMLEAWDSMLDEGKTENDLAKRQIFGAVTLSTALLALSLKTGEDDDEKPVLDITLGYPDDATERGRWQSEKIKEYNVYFNTPDGGRWGIDFGRGFLPQLGAGAYTAEKIKRLRDAVVNSKNDSEIASNVWNEMVGNTSGEVRDLALPLFASIVESDNWQSTKGTTKKLSRFASTFQPLYSATRDVDVILNGQMTQRSDQFDLNMFPIVSMFSDDRVMVSDAFGLVTGERRDWDHNLRLPLTFRDRNEHNLSKEKFEAFKFIQGAGYYRSKALNLTNFLTDNSFLGSLSSEQISELVSQNNVANEAELLTLYQRTFSDRLAKNINSNKDRRNISKINRSLNELKKLKSELKKDQFLKPQFKLAQEIQRVNKNITSIMSTLGGDATTSTKEKLGIDSQIKKAKNTERTF